MVLICPLAEKKYISFNSIQFILFVRGNLKKITMD